MTATDLVAWAKLIGFTEHPDLARCEIDTFRYRVLHVAARITRRADKPDSASTRPGAGRTPSLPPGPGSAPRSPRTSNPDPTRRKTPPARKARPAERHRPTCHTHPAQSGSEVARNRRLTDTTDRTKN
jgi:hypothetical protein